MSNQDVKEVRDKIMSSSYGNFRDCDVALNDGCPLYGAALLPIEADQVNASRCWAYFTPPTHGTVLSG